MKRLLVLTAAAVSVCTAFVPFSAEATSNPPSTTSGSVPPPTCTAVPVVAPRGTTVVSVTTASHAGGTVTFPDASPLPPAAPLPDVPARCDITVHLTHPGANDDVTVKVSLPQDPAHWNGRFRAEGGSGYLAGDLLTSPLVAAVKAGYAAAATDAGVGKDPVHVDGWALTANGAVNTPLLQNFASRSLHDLAVVGKEVTRSFYGNPARYAYWNGCSTGGRQGYEEAQDYPADFQGILANAPAINWDRFAVATLWPQVVFNEENVHPSKCELDAFTTAAVKACDRLDGTRDGVIDDPQACRWDPRRLVGATVVCEGKTIVITARTADAVGKIWAGPTDGHGKRLWFGPEKGASFDWLAHSGVPFFVADVWVRYFLERNPAVDTKTLTYDKFTALFRHSQKEYEAVIGTDDPDLSAFAEAGGKLLSWHGQADELVPTQGTVDYRKRVEHKLGGTARVDEFYRLFLLPGVGHCGDNGSAPTADLAALERWVEKGQAPTTLSTSIIASDGKAHVRDICAYPLHTRAIGHGRPGSSARFRCSAA